MRPKAVIFTHLKPRKLTNSPDDFDNFYRDFGRLIESCVQCAEVAIVFAYVSFGVEEFVHAVDSGGKLPVVLPFDVIENDKRLYNLFHLAIDKAIDETDSHPHRIPKFVFVGVGELASLLNRLWRRDRKLIANLAGSGSFTYDSPKFAEAAIRLIRGGLPKEAAHPIVRIDSDVKINSKAIQEILQQNELQSSHSKSVPYWWLSGCYSGNFPGDPANEHAVRQHWLIDPSTRADRDAFRLVPKAEMFLRDLGELGATQVGPGMPCSAACQLLIQARGGRTLNRPTPQVISGAGLVASTPAIRRLPPFMNAKDMIVWIDDHLKRQLHEAIGDITPGACERITTATLQQDRHHNGITPEDISFAKTLYFSRLAIGCLLCAMIKRIDGRPGPLATCVRAVVHHARTGGEAMLRRQLMQAAQQRLTDVLAVWRSADYGENLLRDWALKLDAAAQQSLCERASATGCAYIRLLKIWGDYVSAIESLDPIDAYWIFTPVRH